MLGTTAMSTDAAMAAPLTAACRVCFHIVADTENDIGLLHGVGYRSDTRGTGSRYPGSTVEA
jgi:hypothetical protein